MSRHRFSLQERIDGTRAALRSRYTPPQLRPSLEKYLEMLRREEASQGRSKIRSLLPARARGSSRGSAKHVGVIASLALALLIAFAAMPSRSPHSAQAQGFAVQQFVFANSMAGGSEDFKIMPSSVGSARIYSLLASCSVGSGSLQIVSNEGLPGQTEQWRNTSGDIGVQSSSYAWVTPVQSPPGQPVDVILTGCGLGSFGVLSVQYGVD